jgi:hypothetical protein
VDTLAPNNRFVKAINTIPITPGIPYHTIMGDRGRGDAPNSSDGVVPYWSSHMDGAKSEVLSVTWPKVIARSSCFHEPPKDSIYPCRSRGWTFGLQPTRAPCS